MLVMGSCVALATCVAWSPSVAPAPCVAWPVRGDHSGDDEVAGFLTIVVPVSRG